MTTTAAIIVGIENWDTYTLPLIESIQQHEPDCWIIVVDNASNIPYPQIEFSDKHPRVAQFRTERLCYSAAINYGQEYFKLVEPIPPDEQVDDITARVREFDWYIVLSNDVLCTGPFAHILEQYSDDNVVGPLMKEVHGFPYLEGWAVFIPRRAWEATGGFDPAFLGSDWEDVDFSTTAREKGFGLIEETDLPFTHLDQRQRFYVIEDFWGKNAHNQALFMRKHGVTK